MVKRYFRYRVFMWTLALGLASVHFLAWFVDYQNEVPVNLPQMLSGNGTFIVTKQAWEGYLPFGHSCGGRNVYGGEGSITVYETQDFKRVSVSYSSHNNPRDAVKEIESRIKEADRVLYIGDSRLKSHPQRFERLALLSSGDGKNRAEIVNYDGKRLIEIYEAPTLEIAKDFEAWEKRSQLTIKHF